MRIIDFKKEHFKEVLKAHPGYSVSEEYLDYLVENKSTYTLVDKEHVVLCGGIKEFWKDRGELWAFFNSGNSPYNKTMHKLILDFIKKANLKRLEMVVYYENILGHKLAKVLGFKLETELMTAYRHDGGDVSMYVRIM